MDDADSTDSGSEVEGEARSRTISLVAHYIDTLVPGPPVVSLSSIIENRILPPDPLDPTIPPNTGLPFPFRWPSREPMSSILSPLEQCMLNPDDYDMSFSNSQDNARLLSYTADHELVYDSLDPDIGYTNNPPQWYKPKSVNDLTLVFESRFESGNLRKAIKVSDMEYDLFLNPDVNSLGHTQWFYFSVSNTRKNMKYKFNILNLIKPNSVFNDGMQPLVYSDMDSVIYGTGWFRSGTNISYYQNEINRMNVNCNYYTATFTLDFSNDHDTVYISYAFPYTYTDLKKHLSFLEKNPLTSPYIKRSTLCYTVAGNPCFLLTITSPISDSYTTKNKKGVVITARVHPGETPGSYMMKGVIDFLVGSSVEAMILRDNFIFKIVPMLNIDGVIIGSYRCGLGGVDLNRCWSTPDPVTNPTIYYTKEMMKAFIFERPVVLYVDLHAHSRKMNVFLYGCENKKGELKRKERILPFIMSEKCELFSYEDSNYKMKKSRDSTGRQVVRKEFKIVNSYTCETTFAGSDHGERAGYYWIQSDYELIGQKLCETLLEYSDPEQITVNRIIATLNEEMEEEKKRKKKKNNNKKSKKREKVLTSHKTKRKSPSIQLSYSPIESFKMPPLLSDSTADFEPFNYELRSRSRSDNPKYSKPPVPIPPTAMSHKRSIAPGPIHSNSLSVRVKLSLNNNDVDSDNEIGPFRQNASASSTSRYARDFDEKLPNI